MKNIEGIHHITAVAGDPVKNWKFYTQVLGERMVKKTVNFDDPGTYHLYYGDQQGSPGSILTFFPWAGMRRVRTGNNQVSATSYTIAENSLDYWAARLEELGVDADPFERFGESGLAFADPDGMPVEVIGSETAPESPYWEKSPVPNEHRLRGFHSATSTVAASTKSLALLTDVFGMKVVDQKGDRTRLAFDGGNVNGMGTLYDVVVDPKLENHGLGAGIVHHIAFRAKDLEHEAEIRELVQDFGLQPTTHIDRDYFMSVYFREPSGILYEIATDPPGFTRDEPLATLGESLRLPKQHESLRARLEKTLVPIPPVNG
jgi:glyoxalase family protein